MPIQLKEENGGKILTVHVSGELAKSDYEKFVPEFARLVLQHGKLRVLFDMTGFHGWDAGALWEDIKFDMKHFADIEQLAMVGEKKWQRACRRSANRSRQRHPVLRSRQRRRSAEVAGCSVERRGSTNE